MLVYYLYTIIIITYYIRMRMYATSEYFIQDLRRPDRHTPMKVLTAKTYTFVEDIWKLYVQRNIQALRCAIFSYSMQCVHD